MHLGVMTPQPVLAAGVALEFADGHRIGREDRMDRRAFGLQQVHVLADEALGLRRRRRLLGGERDLVQALDGPRPDVVE